MFQQLPTAQQQGQLDGCSTAEVVVFGGADQGVDQNHTWSWNGTAWAKLSTTASPEAREQFGTVWDPAAKEFLIFGEYEFTSNRFYSDTWQLQ